MTQSHRRTPQRHLAVVHDNAGPLPVPACVGDVEITVTVDPTQDLEIKTFSRKVETTVQVSGQLDFADAHLLRSVVDTQVTLGCRRMRLDLAPLTFCDCTGLGVIVHAHNAMISRSGRLLITGVSPRVQKLLTLTHLDEALDVQPGANVPARPTLTMVGSGRRSAPN
jgi:anti-sigma B factor antagonist